MEYVDLTDDDSLSDKIKINLHMFSALMLNRVGGEIHGANVVIVDESAPRRRTLELMKQLAQQVASATPLATVQYSASALDRETAFYRLTDQDTRLSPRNTA
jgi:hypoxanthine phosphoribosyltransferase